VQRRAVLATAATPWALAGCDVKPVQGFATMAAARQAIESLATGARGTGAWTLAQMLEHAAQSVEYSMHGFPQAKSAVFQATVGKLAFAIFDGRGRMSHSLAEPIPGAPAIAPGAPLDKAIARALKAYADFEAYGGALAPHFAYGALDKAQYTRAHLMHLADHWAEVARS
jgi:hypothetical protein